MRAGIARSLRGVMKLNADGMAAVLDQPAAGPGIFAAENSADNNSSSLI